MVKNLLKVLLLIHNICDITPFIITPHNIMLRKPYHNINTLKMTNKDIKYIFNDNIYNNTKLNITTDSKYNISEIQEDNIITKFLKNFQKNTTEVEYEYQIDKYFAKRHLFGLSDYDFAIFRISLYFYIWYIVMYKMLSSIDL